MMTRFALTWLLLIPTFAIAKDGTPATVVTTDVFAGTGKSSVATHDDSTSTTTKTNIALGNPFGVEIIGDDVWITTVDDQCVWQTSLSEQTIVRVAGDGRNGYDGDGGPATKAAFNWPHEVRVDSEGNLFIADTRNHVVRRVDAKTQIVNTIAGNGRAGFAGESKSGTDVQFDQPHSVVLDGEGGLLVADTKNHRLRRIDLGTGVVTTIAGTGDKTLPADGADARTSPLFGPRSLAVDAKSIWIALREGNSIWRLDRKTNTLHCVAGTGKKGYTGDGGDPLHATFSGPKGITIDADGNLLIVDTENHAVRKIDFATNTIATVMGGPGSDDSAKLKRPHGIAASKNLFLLGDSENHRVLIGQ